jgi:hypothetical protein
MAWRPATLLTLMACIPACAQTPHFSFFARHDIMAAITNATPFLSSLGVADFNGDGIMDMAMADAANSARVMLGNGNLQYSTTLYPTPFEPQAIVIGDFNNDGHPDFAIGTFNAGLAVYINNGDGTFAAPTVYAVGNNLGLATADVDHDGNLDLIGEDFVLLGLGNGKFEDSVPLVRTSTRPAGFILPGTEPTATSVIGSTVAVADLNGDGNIDVVATGPIVAGDVEVFLGNGNGTFNKVRNTGCETAGNSVAIADFNNDGFPDLAFTQNNGEVAVCLGKGDGTFDKVRLLSSGSTIQGQSIITYDLNGDGHMDIALVNINRGGPAGVMAVLYGKGDGTFKPAVDYEMFFPFGIAEGDLNGDGIPDLVVPGGEGTDPLIFAFLGTSNGKLQAAPDYKVAVSTPKAFVPGDFNGDGNIDLAVTGSASNNVTILIGNGKGGFTQGDTYDTGNIPMGVVTGDFNGDGKLDLAVVNNGLDNVSILLGNGDGTFESAVSFGAGQSPVDAVSGDFNGDGKLDLAVTNSAGNNVSILLGKGDGTFGAPTNFATGMEPESIAVGDLNGDGILDLAVSNAVNGADSISVLFGNGDGTFQPAVTLSTGGTESAGILIADLNGDGNPDIVVANFGSANVSVFLGNGAGAFESPVISSVFAGIFESGPFALTLGSFTGKGSTDLAVVAYNLQDVALLPGLGNGQFGPPTLFGADALPVAIANVPLVKGKPSDLVVVNSATNLVSVLRNTGK